MSGYGNKLKRLRGARSQADVAASIGVSQQAYAAYEKEDARPRDEIKVKIANLFGVTVQSLFYPDAQQKVVD